MTSQTFTKITNSQEPSRTHKGSKEKKTKAEKSLKNFIPAPLSFQGSNEFPKTSAKIMCVCIYMSSEHEQETLKRSIYKKFSLRRSAISTGESNWYF